MTKKFDVIAIDHRGAIVHRSEQEAADHTEAARNAYGYMLPRFRSRITHWEVTPAGTYDTEIIGK